MPWGAGQDRTGTSAWKALRAQALTRDRYTCTTPSCGSHANQVDHIVPKHKGGRDELPNLASLCQPCHAAKSSREGLEARRAMGTRRRLPEAHPGLRA